MMDNSFYVLCFIDFKVIHIYISCQSYNDVEGYIIIEPRILKAAHPNRIYNIEIINISTDA